MIVFVIFCVFSSVLTVAGTALRVFSGQLLAAESPVSVSPNALAAALDSARSEVCAAVLCGLVCCEPPVARFLAFPFRLPGCAVRDHRPGRIDTLCLLSTHVHTLFEYRVLPSAVLSCRKARCKHPDACGCIQESPSANSTKQWGSRPLWPVDASLPRLHGGWLWPRGAWAWLCSLL